MRWPLPFAVTYLTLLANGSPLSLNPGYNIYHLQNSTQELFSRAGEPDIPSLFLLEDGLGSCTGKVDTINFWLEEARELHSTILRAFRDASKDTALRVLWFCYFGLKYDKYTLEPTGDTEKLVGIIEGYNCHNSSKLLPDSRLTDLPLQTTFLVSLTFWIMVVWRTHKSRMRSLACSARENHLDK